MASVCVKELCRFCGQSDKKLKSLFDDKDFLKKYKLAVPLPIIKDDLLPQRICGRCKLTVECFHDNIVICQELNRKWISQIQKEDDRDFLQEIFDTFEDKRDRLEDFVDSQIELRKHNWNSVKSPLKKAKNVKSLARCCIDYTSSLKFKEDLVLYRRLRKQEAPKVTKVSKREKSSSPENTPPETARKVERRRGRGWIKGRKRGKRSDTSASSERSLKNPPKKKRREVDILLDAQKEAELMLNPKPKPPPPRINYSAGLIDSESDFSSDASEYVMQDEKSDTSSSDDDTLSSYSRVREPLNCKYCDSIFPDFESLAQHQTLHMVLKLWNLRSNPVLDRQFRRLTQADGEMMQCENCISGSQFFAQDFTMIKAHWDEMRCQYFCRICGEKFHENPKRMERHYREIHGVGIDFYDFTGLEGDLKDLMEKEKERDEREKQEAENKEIENRDESSDIFQELSAASEEIPGSSKSIEVVHKGGLKYFFSNFPVTKPPGKRKEQEASEEEKPVEETNVPVMKISSISSIPAQSFPVDDENSDVELVETPISKPAGIKVRSMSSLIQPDLWNPQGANSTLYMLLNDKNQHTSRVNTELQPVFAPQSSGYSQVGTTTFYQPNQNPQGIPVTLQQPNQNFQATFTQTTQVTQGITPAPQSFGVPVTLQQPIQSQISYQQGPQGVPAASQSFGVPVTLQQPIQSQISYQQGPQGVPVTLQQPIQSQTSYQQGSAQISAAPQQIRDPQVATTSYQQPNQNSPVTHHQLEHHIHIPVTIRSNPQRRDSVLVELNTPSSLIHHRPNAPQMMRSSTMTQPVVQNPVTFVNNQSSMQFFPIVSQQQNSSSYSQAQNYQNPQIVTQNPQIPVIVTQNTQIPVTTTQNSGVVQPQNLQTFVMQQQNVISSIIQNPPQPQSQAQPQQIKQAGAAGYQCQVCKKNFNNQYAANDHFRREHQPDQQKINQNNNNNINNFDPDENPLPMCQICESYFGTSWSDVQQHINEIHFKS